MPYEQKDMSGSLFRNEKKETESQPNARGSAKINGVDYWVSAWTKKDKNGNPWQSLAFTAKEQQATAEPQAKALAKELSAIAGMDDDIPF